MNRDVIITCAVTDELIERMVDGTQAQAAGRSVAELEQLRDDCLFDIMRALAKYRIGAGLNVPAEAIQ